MAGRSMRMQTRMRLWRPRSRHHPEVPTFQDGVTAAGAAEDVVERGAGVGSEKEGRRYRPRARIASYIFDIKVWQQQEAMAHG